MPTSSQDFQDIWRRVVDMLVAGTDVREGEPLPLKANHKALLRSVQAVGSVNGFVLLTAGNEMVQTLVKAELADRIEAALLKTTGQAQQVVVTISEDTGNEVPSSHDASSASASTGQDSASSHRPAQTHGTQSPAAPGPRHGSRQSLYDDRGRTPESDPTSWRTVEFERDTADSSVFGTSSEHDGGQLRDHDGHFGQSGSRTQTDGASFPPAGGHAPAPTGPSVQGTAADLFGRGKYKVGDLRNPMSEPVEEPTLNPKYTFETFVIGPQNRFAAAAAAAVAEQPARAYNPLFISGGSGLGKTHLLHAIGHYATALDPKLRVRYVSSEEFTNDFINSVRDDAQESFKRRYRDLDILIVDDIQFLEGKEGTQEEFFHTFNALHQADRQIVLSSDRPPRELKTLEERLRTRFEWGLTPDLQLPDLETRIAILSKKAQLDRLNVPHDVLQFIAEHTASSIRELEGRLLQVTAQASLLKMPVTLSLAEEIIGSDAAEVEITPDIIISATAEFYGLAVADLTGAGKTRPVSHARQVAMYLTRSLIDISLPAIGKVFGGRDHSTVLYAHRKIQKEIADKRATRDQVNDLTTRIRERSRTLG
ncbi:chromosomal replication initiator protein DnaA [uncultured Corynebacterium sp.]|uniref:chromosomal replication initiator protein DnaA n=1 Tax=uncultured Corynebacterium sp. TaxID=159447 RepID=UPI0025F389A0|nr:chromosomal replication initiator protein DnaA [uncultured Corynebacterium sp.]